MRAMIVQQQQPKPDRPRIMVVITKADVGGAQVHVRQILNGLGANYEFILVAGEEDYLTEQARQAGVEVAICPDLVRPINPLRDLKALLSLRRLIKHYKPNLLHTHSFKAGMVGRIAALFCGIPALFTAHGWAFTPGVPTPQRVLGFVIEFALSRITNAVIVVSKHDFNLALRSRVVASRKLNLVHNCTDLVEVSSTPEDTPVKLVSLGRLVPVQKNQLMLVEVMTALPSSVTLTIVGEGVHRQLLEDRITELGLENRVNLPGEVEDIRPYLSSGQIFVLSSDYEGLPLSVLEALCSGLPVVATDVGGVREAVIEGETGYLVPRGDVTRFAQKANALIESPTLRTEMGKRGHQHYQAHFIPELFLEKTDAVYSKVLGR